MPLWDALITRLAPLVERFVQIWLAFKAGQWRQQKIEAQTTAEIKDEQNNAAAERPLDRDELVRRLRERGF